MIVIVPVDDPHAGWVRLTVGAAGAGLAFKVTPVPADVHPAAFLAVTLYVPTATDVEYSRCIGIS